MRVNTPNHRLMQAVYDAAEQRLGEADKLETTNGLHIARLGAGRLALSHSFEVQSVKVCSNISFDEGRTGLPLVTRTVRIGEIETKVENSMKEWRNIAGNFVELLTEQDDERIIDLNIPAQARADSPQVVLE